MTRDVLRKKQRRQSLARCRRFEAESWSVETRRLQSEIYRECGRASRVSTGFCPFHVETVVVSPRFPNSVDALGLFACATFGARKDFRADLDRCSRLQTEARAAADKGRPLSWSGSTDWSTVETDSAWIQSMWGA